MLAIGRPGHAIHTIRTASIALRQREWWLIPEEQLDAGGSSGHSYAHQHGPPGIVLALLGFLPLALGDEGLLPLLLADTGLQEDLLVQARASANCVPR